MQSSVQPCQDSTLTTGIVSHEFASMGCKTIIRATASDGNSITLIPSKEQTGFEKTGIKVKFHYRLLRMPQPAGCSEGIPAEITDLCLLP